MRNELKEKLNQSAASFRMPRYAEITDVGLYLEQTVRFVNGYLDSLGEPGLTPSMVSNYVKHKLLERPVKKLYGASHIARLMFIAVTKPVISLEDARMMFELQLENCDLPTAYDYFCDEFENVLRDAFGVAPAVDGLGETQSEMKDLLRSMIIAAVNKIYLDQCMTAYRDFRQNPKS